MALITSDCGQKHQVTAGLAAFDAGWAAVAAGLAAWPELQVSRGLQLQSLWRTPTAAVG